jgi:hypothetical protein
VYISLTFALAEDGLTNSFEVATKILAVEPDIPSLRRPDQPCPTA